MPRMRTTRYQDDDPQQRKKAFNAPVLIDVVNESAGKRQRDKRLQPAMVDLHALTPAPGQSEQVVLMAACD